MIPISKQDALLHILRNPHGWSDDAVRDVRQQAADELERLWRLEQSIRHLHADLTGLVGDRK